MIVKSFRLVFSLDLFVSVLYPVVYMPNLSVRLNNYFPFCVFIPCPDVFKNNNYIQLFFSAK